MQRSLLYLTITFRVFSQISQRFFSPSLSTHLLSRPPLFLSLSPSAIHTLPTHLMGFSKDDKPLKKVVIVLPRWIKTLFFLITMLISLLLFSAPILLVIADALLPSAFLSAAVSPPSLSLQALSSHLNNYDFRYSLIDIPLVSIIRSAIILCVYSFCDGPRLSRGPYLGIATVCSAASLVFVSLKASYVFMNSSYDKGGYVRAMEAAMFVSSLVLAIGHVVVAYRTSCRERRKLLVYKIDIEAVSACKNGFPRYQKILEEARAK